VYRDLAGNPDVDPVPGVIALRLEGALFFVTADSLEDRIDELIDTAETPPEVVILDLQSVTFVDAQGASKLGEIAGNLRGRGLPFRLAAVKPQVMEVFVRDGLIERIGPSNVHLNVDAAVTAHLEVESRK
jgi:anti-anti-sigma factor